ncbi:MAG TPA: hypothetical protein VNJ02_13635 [Vicinamibacterales bacterium]|nr:hypothetical protein [Vicinamibacterales bacterium]
MFRFANRRNTRVSFFLGALMTVALPSLVAAQGPGVRAGVSVEPDQFYVGGHYETSALIERLHFKPNVEVGFGDGLTHVGVNFEAVYKFDTDSDWDIYGGGGPALNLYSADGNSDTEAGLNFVVGAENSRGLFFEVKVGAIDSPNLKFGVGWSFR